MFVNEPRRVEAPVVGGVEAALRDGDAGGQRPGAGRGHVVRGGPGRPAAEALGRAAHGPRCAAPRCVHTTQ